MPARVVLVHDDADFVDLATTAIKAEGYSVAAFLDPFKALNALDAAKTVDLLITHIPFGEGKPNGVSIAHMTRNKRPGLKVLFATLPETEEHTVGVGEFLPLPVSPAKLVEVVNRALRTPK